METKEEERKWHLVRNDNGEWISDENVVFLTKVEAQVTSNQSQAFKKENIYSAWL